MKTRNVCIWQSLSQRQTLWGCGTEIISNYFKTLTAFLQQQGNGMPAGFLPLDHSTISKMSKFKAQGRAPALAEGSNAHSRLAPGTVSEARDIYSAAMPPQVALSYLPQSNGCCSITPWSHSEWTTQVFSFGSMMNLMQQPHRGKERERQTGLTCMIEQGLG